MTSANVSPLALVHDSADNGGYVESWRLHLQVDHRPLTVKTYLATMRAFVAWLDTSGRSSDLLSVSKHDCEAWFAHMIDAGNAPNTRRGRWCALRCFYAWLVEEDEIAVNPMERVKVSRPVNEPTRILDETELSQLLATVSGNDFYSRRDKAIILFMVTTGVRKGECSAVTMGDVDMATGVVWIPDGKGGKSRRVWLSPTALVALDRYLRLRKRNANSESDWLWLGKAGRFTHAGIDIMMRKHGAEANLTGMRSHVLRHTWAHMLKGAGASDGDLMTLGGWSEPSMLHRYGAVAATSRALDAARKLDPFANVR
jgi:integrase/recombinase XerD